MIVLLHRSPISRLGIGLLLFIFLFLQQVFPARAAFNMNPAEVGTLTNFFEWRNEYRTDFGMPPLYMWDKMEVYFETSGGMPFTKEYSYAEIASRVMWLTCNGTYQFRYYNGSVMVAWSGLIETTLIIDPPCESYPDGGASDDLNGRYSDNGDGTYKVEWDDIPGADEYEIWQNGELIDTIPATGGPYDYDLEGGSVTIVGKDTGGNVVGHSDLQVPAYDGWEGEEPCDVCAKLQTLLTCPGWNDYMGELSQMIQSAIGHFFGPVPAAPSTSEIESEIVPELPEVDTSYDDADLEPVVPNEFNTPLVFDITNGPQISVVDESEPIEIDEPDANIDADAPGVMVYPGDERNSSGGIKEPETIETEYPMPEPSPTGSPPPDVEYPMPSVPPSDMPIPDFSGGDVPTPSGGGGGEE